MTDAAAPSRLAGPLRRRLRSWLLRMLFPRHYFLVAPEVDTAFYRAANPDLDAEAIDLIEHFVLVGWREGRDPSPAFSVRRYLAANADVAESGQNPLVHFLLHGRSEGRRAFAVDETAPLPRGSEPREIAGLVPYDPLLAGVLVVGHVVGRERYGGERSFLDMLEGLSGVGLNVVAVLPRDEGEYTAAVRARSSKVVVLPYGWWRGGEAASSAVVSAFEGLVARYRVAVVHANTVMLLEPLVAARRAGARAVVHAREILAHDPALCERIGLSAEEIVAAVWSRSDAVIANSAACASAYAAALGAAAETAGPEADGSATDAETGAAAETASGDAAGAGARVASGDAAGTMVAGGAAASGDAVAAASAPASAAAVASADGRRVLVVANAVDASALDMANPVPETGPVRFALISSNVAKKGLEDLVRLARACAAAGVVDAEFVVVGPETETVKALQAGQAAGEVPASIRFAGYAEGPAAALEGVQVVLNLSRFAESFGRTVAEAMAARRPVIAYRFGALPELVEDGVTGFLVPYGEAEAAVAAVKALLADRSLIGRMGEAGRASVTARYDKPAYRAAMQAAYREILATPPHGGGDGTGGGGPAGGGFDPTAGSGVSARLGAQAVAPAITAAALAVRLPEAGEGAVVLPARARPGGIPASALSRGPDVSPGSDVPPGSDAAPASGSAPAASPEPGSPTADCRLPTAGAQSAPLPTAGAQSARIAYFLWHFPVPSETFVLNELRYLVEAGYDVKVWCRQSPHKDFAPDFPIEWERVASPEAFAERLVATGRTAVHAHFTYPTVTDMVWPACEIAGVPFTFIAHSQDIFRHGNDQKNRVGEIGRSAWCRKVFVPARFHRDYLIERGVPEGKLAINPNGVDVDAYAAARRPGRGRGATKRIVAVHRFTEKKGLEPLIAAMAILARAGASRRRGGGRHHPRPPRLWRARGALRGADRRRGADERPARRPGEGAGGARRRAARGGPVRLPVGAGGGRRHGRHPDGGAGGAGRRAAGARHHGRRPRRAGGGRHHRGDRAGSGARGAGRRDPRLLRACPRAGGGDGARRHRHGGGALPHRPLDAGADAHLGEPRRRPRHRRLEQPGRARRGDRPAPPLHREPVPPHGGRQSQRRRHPAHPGGRAAAPAVDDLGPERRQRLRRPPAPTGRWRKARRTSSSMSAARRGSPSPRAGTCRSCTRSPRTRRSASPARSATPRAT